MSEKKLVVVEAMVTEDPLELVSLLRISLELELDIPGFEVIPATPKKIRPATDNMQIILLLGLIDKKHEKDLKNHPNVIDVSAHPAVISLFESISG